MNSERNGQMDRKKIFGIFGKFLVVMLVFTILSRAVSGASMARVETVRISTGTIEHKVTGSGRVEAGKEVAVYTQSGQRVKEICVQEGQAVKKGELLFRVDMEELEEQILTAQQELEKLSLQSQDAQSALSIEQQNHENARSRAQEDYNSAVAEGDLAVAQAKAAWDQAESDLQAFLNTNPRPLETGGEDSKDASEGEDQQQRNPEEQGGFGEDGQGTKTGHENSNENDGQGNEEAGKRTENDMNEHVSSPKKTLPAIQISFHQKGHIPMQLSFDGESQDGIDAVAQWEAQKAALEQAAAEAKAAYEAALSSRAENVKSAARALEDASVPGASNSTSRQNEITRKQQELVLDKLLELKEAKGKVTAPVRGMVTKVEITTGDFTSDGTAIRLADTSKGGRLVVPVDKFNEKYISKGDLVTIIAGGDKEKISDYTISNISGNEEDSNLLDVTVDLPEGVLEAGMSAEIEINPKSKNYSSMIPIQALYEDQSGYYVWILQEEQGVMGKQLVVKRFGIEVLDKNSANAALADGMLTNDQEIVSSSSRMIEDGSRVRKNEK